MTDHFIGVFRGNLGTRDDKFVMGTSAASPAADLEVRIADAKNWTRQELYTALNLIADKIVHVDPHITATLFPKK